MLLCLGVGLILGILFASNLCALQKSRLSTYGSWIQLLEAFYQLNPEDKISVIYSITKKSSRKPTTLVVGGSQSNKSPRNL